MVHRRADELTPGKILANSMCVYEIRWRSGGRTFTLFCPDRIPILTDHGLRCTAILGALVSVLKAKEGA